MTPERGGVDTLDLPEPEGYGGQAFDSYRLCVFVSEGFPSSPAAVRRGLLERQPADADLAIARFERALRQAPELEPVFWAAPPQRFGRGVRLHLGREASHDSVIQIETIARRQGLAVLDEELEEITFSCPLGARPHIEDATRVLCDAHAGYLMIEGGPANHAFVQVFAQADREEIRLESVGNRALPWKYQLDRSQAAELRRRGWRPPRGSELNFSRTLPLASPAATGRLPTLLRDALRVHGLVDSSPIAICLTLG